MGVSHRYTSFIIAGFLLLGAAQPAEAKKKDQDKSKDEVTAIAEEMSDGEGSVSAPYSGPHIVINAAARKLKLYDEKDNVVKTFSVAVGTPGHRTPIGPRSMNQIVWNPWWIPPNSPWARGASNTPPGPKNPLGPVKMKLGDAIMLHGTNKDDSVGHAASHGCMRMHNEDAKELARYLQERVMGQRDETTYAEYDAHRGRSYYVNLTQNIPVEVVYEIAEIEDGQLKVYPDIYWRVKDKVGTVTALLTNNGYNVEKIDMGFLQETMKQAKGETEVALPVKELMLAYRDKMMKTAQAETAE